MEKLNKSREAVKRKDGGEAAEKYIKYGIIGFIVVAVIALGVALFLTFNRPVVATVGNEKITVEEFKFFLKQQKDNMLYLAGITPGTEEENAFWNSKIQGENALEVAKKNAMEGVRALKIQVIKAKEQGIKLEKDDLDLINADIKSLIEQNRNRIETNRYLQEEYGVNIDQLKDIYKDIILRDKLIEKEISNMNITDEDLKKVYDENTKLYDKLTVRHILFTTEGNDGNRTAEESKKLAEDTLAKVNAGEEMAALAKELSEDPGVTENEGQYVFNKYDSYVEEFKNWAVEANVGDTGIVETYYGYHVMKLEDRTATPFEEVKENIKSELINERYSNLLEEWKKDPKYALVKDQKLYDSIK